MYGKIIAPAFWTCNSPMASLRGLLRGLLRTLRMVFAARFEHTCSRRSENQGASVFKNASPAMWAVGGNEMIITTE